MTTTAVDRTIVWVRGEHDIATAAHLAETMAVAMTLGEGNFLVDLNGVQFMDASTVGVIINARNLLRTRSRSLTLRSPSLPARRVLSLCGLDELVATSPF